ncbi:M20/M25/M40 family metallo-hydrolase [Chloroflexi bacterium TSY]|nr:M20/M25/M40 family metallo-hydrolase [Chloroflexi bacterium TSY]
MTQIPDRKRAIELLTGLVSIPSLSRQEADASRWLVEQMEELGYSRAYVDEAGNAVGELGTKSAGRTVVLLGHIDTVPGNIEVRVVNQNGEDLLYGRGSVDAKGPLATFVAAVSRLGEKWAVDNDFRIVVVGAVEEEAATSKGARYIGRRFDGETEPIPNACIIGEPSSWRRVTLGYKGRLLLELSAVQPMAHTAGPDPGVATVATDLWNWIVTVSNQFNQEKSKAFDQLLPSLRRINTSTTDEMNDCVEMQVGIRLPVAFDETEFVKQILGWAAERIDGPLPDLSSLSPPLPHTPIEYQLDGQQTRIAMRFHGHEAAWRSDRRNGLVRSFLGAIRQLDSTVRPGFVEKTGTSDMNVVGPLWRCPVLAYGPGDSKLDHTPNEHVSLDEYWRAVQVLEQALRNLAQTEI